MNLTWYIKFNENCRGGEGIPGFPHAIIQRGTKQDDRVIFKSMYTPIARS